MYVIIGNIITCGSIRRVTSLIFPIKVIQILKILEILLKAEHIVDIF